MAYIKKKSTGSYLITVSCGRDSQGKKISRSVTYRPDLVTAKGNPKSESAIEKDVSAFAADFERKVLTGQYTEGVTLTFEAYSLKYLSEYAEQYQAPRTLEFTKASIKRFTAAFGYMPLANLNPLFLQEYVNTLSKTPKAAGKPGILSYNTVKRHMAVLSAMLSQAVRWNLITSNPMERVQLRKNQTEVTQDKPMFFSQEQAEAFLNALDNPLYYSYSSSHRETASGQICDVCEYQAAHRINHQIKLFFYLAMFTGCRRGELLALQWSDIDFEKSAVHINKSVCRAGGKLIVKTTKTKGSVRTIAVPDAVINMARKWKHEQSVYRLSIGSQWIGENWLFIQWNGALMGLETPYQAFHRIISNYNANRKENDPELPVIPLHGLRHTAATLLISHGIDIRTVSGRLGHASTSTTLNIYSHALEEMDKTAADTLAGLFKKTAE